MADVFDKAGRSRVMRAVGSKDTGPEMKVRRALHGMGLRYGLHRKDLAGKPDIVMPRWKSVVFVHGCFWHGHDCARGARLPAANQDYWTAKIARNRARDIKSGAELAASGWRVIVVWECETRDMAALGARLRGLFPGNA